MGGYRIAFTACCVLGLLSARSAHADELQPDPGPEGKQIDLTYLFDGGALPFLWAPLVGRVLLDEYTTPRATPYAFGDEGGAEKADWQVPGWAISSLGGVSALGMVLSGDESRMFHVKGMAQTLATGVFITGTVKVAVGRHRPDWSEDANTPGSRRSFPSGHSTQAFAIATYTALYLRGHVFDKYRGDRVLPWWEAAAYGGLALGATALAGERVYHNRHHLSDVVIGGLVGSATSALFYWYQDNRFEDRRAGEQRKQLVVTPAEKGRGGTVGLSFGW